MKRRKRRKMQHSPLLGTNDSRQTADHRVRRDRVCRQFHTIVDLCKAAEAFCADIVSRSLFETVVAAYFVLKHKFHIVIDLAIDKCTRKPLDGKWTVKPARLLH
jgi:hypothetical protein